MELYFKPGVLLTWEPASNGVTYDVIACRRNDDGSYVIYVEGMRVLHNADRDKLKIRTV